MTAFRPLPFQFVQRGVDLIKDDPKTVAKFHEQRDQDLENYLAGLSGFAWSYALFTSGAAGTNLVGAGDVSYDWSFTFGINRYETGTYTGDNPSGDIALAVTTSNYVDPTDGGFATINDAAGIVTPLFVFGTTHTTEALRIATADATPAGLASSTSATPVDFQIITGPAGTPTGNLAVPTAIIIDNARLEILVLHQ